jgi:DNA-directed RNA polymerase sigma subunit (sigma70/sigma32)
MDEMITGTVGDYVPNTHPVLQQLNEKIADLESKVAKGLELDSQRIETINRIRNEKWAYEAKVKTVLVEALEDHDEDTVKYIAEQLGVELTKTKQVEVNVTFTIDVEYEIGEEPDPEWDFDFEVTHSTISDFQTDIIWSKDA